MILCELTAAVDSSGTLQTFYVSSERFVTSPTDTPSNTAFDTRIVQPGNIGIHVYADGRTGGGSKLELGELILSNADGALDAWTTYSFDGRPVTIRLGTSGSYPSAFTNIFVGTVESVDASWDKITIRLRDKQWRFTLPVLSTYYGGTNSLPNGLDGTPSDLKGKVRPKTYGKVYNVPAPCINTSRLEFEVGVCNSVDNVYDNGVALTKGADYTSQADMETNAPAASNFRVWPAGGYFRLGSTPAGQITADVTQGAVAGNRTVAQIIKQLALDAGLTSGEISSGDVTALDAANSSVVGIWIDEDTTTFSSAMDQIAASVGAWYGIDSAGVLRMGQLTAPSGSPLITLHDYDIYDNIQRRTAKDTGVPIWSMTVDHSKIWQTQASGIATSVTADRRAYLSQQFRKSTATDSTIKTQWLLADILESEGLLTSSTDADAESSRRLTLFKARRDIFDVTVQLDVVTSNAIMLMSVVALQISRFSLSAGKNFRVIGMIYDLQNNSVTLSLWG